MSTIYLLTNDDGIDAPGLGALHAALMSWHTRAGHLEEASADSHSAPPKPHAPPTILTVAPAMHLSGCSHQVSTHAPVRIERRGPLAFAVHGTPADCVRLAVLHLLPELGITPLSSTLMVLSGINEGGNLGADIYISGTVAAAREAAFFGLPAIALSQYRKGLVDWPRTTRLAARTLAELARHPHTPGSFWNVNFPAEDARAADLSSASPLMTPSPDPALVFCPRSTDPLPVKYQREADLFTYDRALYHTRPYEQGTDVDLCFHGQIAVSQIAL